MGKEKKTSDAERQFAVYVIFILIAGVLLYCVAMKLFYRPQANNTPGTQATESLQIQYEKVDLQVMLDELDANALRAEETYQDKYVEITGKITVFDSDGKYIAIEPIEATAWSIDSVHCSLTDPTHKAFLLEKNVGDVVTIKGKVISIGEIQGYSVKIAEISD